MEEEKYLFSYRKLNDPLVYIEERTEEQLSAQELQLMLNSAIAQFIEIYERLPPSLRKRFLLQIKAKE